MYHNSGTKLDMPVEFPFELDASEVCPNLPADVKTLSLVAVVCHFGSKCEPFWKYITQELSSRYPSLALQGGHYTAFVRRPTNGSWVYCNDSQVSQVLDTQYPSSCHVCCELCGPKWSQLSPSSKDAESAYILFYQREPLWAGYDSTVLKAKNLTFNDVEEMKRVEQLMLSGNNAKAGIFTLHSQGVLKRTNSDREYFF